VNHLNHFRNSALVVAPAMLLAACQASSPAPEPVTGGYPPPPATTAAPAAAAIPPGSTTNALTSSLNAAPANGTAQPLDPTLAGAAGAILDKVAGSMAPGMSREGSPMAATFQTGQTMEQVIPLQTGRCYTVVASGPTVQAWDFSLVLVPGPVPITPLLARESATGNTAALAGNGHCYQWNWLPAQARVVVKVTQGGGVAVAQLYGK
jgi:hypothetical protein